MLPQDGNAAILWWFVMFLPTCNAMMDTPKIWWYACWSKPSYCSRVISRVNIPQMRDWTSHLHTNFHLISHQHELFHASRDSSHIPIVWGHRRSGQAPHQRRRSWPWSVGRAIGTPARWRVEEWRNSLKHPGVYLPLAKHRTEVSFTSRHFGKVTPEMVQSYLPIF